jgi:hypothetical protein
MRPVETLLDPTLLVTSKVWSNQAMCHYFVPMVPGALLKV